MSAEVNKIVSPEHVYSIPRREVTSIDDMGRWLASEAYFEYLGFLNSLNEEVKGKPLKGKYSKSPCVDTLLDLLKLLDTWITEIPPLEQPQRFGNKAFRTWHGKLKTEIPGILLKMFPPEFTQAMCEVQEYLIESFGNATRIDYGTGHEMAFCMFLSCLFKIGALFMSDRAAVVCYVFSRYLEVVRRLQTVYKMEPAGSRGVWALDDYQFVPFIWGSSQLSGHPRISPSSFVKPDMVNAFADDYLFLGCIKYITQVKTGPFAEHSNQLWSISAVPTWEKINTGLIRMYKAEVLSKFPVVQHVLFGSLLRMVPADLEVLKPKTIGTTKLQLEPPRPSPAAPSSTPDDDEHLITK